VLVVVLELFLFFVKTKYQFWGKLTFVRTGLLIFGVLNLCYDSYVVCLSKDFVNIALISFELKK